MKIARARILLIFFLVSFFARPVAAAVIDFETTPGGTTPLDDGALSSPDNIAGGGTGAAVRGFLVGGMERGGGSVRLARKHGWCAFPSTRSGQRPMVV